MVMMPSRPGNEAVLPLTLLPSMKLPLILDRVGSVGLDLPCVLGEPTSGPEEQSL